MKAFTEQNATAPVAKSDSAAPTSLKTSSETPADGGDNISRSPQSARPVGAIDTSPEVRAVVEQQEPETTTAPVFAGSDVNWPAVVDSLEKIVDEKDAAISLLHDRIEELTDRKGGKTIHIAACPFCGNDDVEIEELISDQFAISCPECEAVGPRQPSTMDAISYWNDRRAA